MILNNFSNYHTKSMHYTVAKNNRKMPLIVFLFEVDKINENYFFYERRKAMFGKNKEDMTEEELQAQREKNVETAKNVAKKAGKAYLKAGVALSKGIVKTALWVADGK